MTDASVAAGHERTSRSGGTPSPPLLRVVPPAGTHNDNVWGDWRDRGACRGYDPDMFFPPKHGNQTEIKQICAGCDVRVDCLEYALELNIQHGVWGGLSTTKRRAIRKQRYRAGLAPSSGALRPVPGGGTSAARSVLAPAQPSGRAAHP